MSTSAQKIGGQIVAMAEHYLPDYSFAAVVHRGEDVTLYLFKGRLLERSSRLAPGSKTLELFKALQAETAVKAGFFKRRYYATARVCVRARGRRMSTQTDFDDADAYTPQTDNPRAAFTTVMGDDLPDVAARMFRDPLPKGLSPREIAEHYMADHTTWTAYAMEEHAHGDSEARWNQQQSYDNLIVRFCGPDKQYQGVTFGSDAPFDPAQTTITAERVDGDRAFIDTHFQNAKFDFLTHDHQYEFARDHGNAPWRLVEIWYRAAPDDLAPCL